MEIENAQDNNLEIDKKVNSKLRKYGMPNATELKPNILEYLIKVEQVITEIENEKKSYISQYKSSKLNVKSIGERVGMSRTTIYKYKEILETYITNSQKELEEHDVLNQLQEKTELVNELMNMNQKLKENRLEEMIKLDKVDALQNELNNALKQIQNLQKENIRLNNLLNKNSNSKQDKVIQIF